MTTAPDRPSLPIPWGENDSLGLDLPPDWPAPEVVRPDLSGVLDDYAAALSEALDRPEAGATLGERVGPRSTVAVVVDDPSRWTPVREALPAVLARLHAAGVKEQDVTISAGVGRHHAVDGPAMRRRVGEEVAARYRCFSPPVDDLSEYEDLGKTSGGVPVRVFRPVVRADLRVLIGSVLPHLQAGFGGGYKLIFPGTSHRSTLGAIHRRGIDGSSGSTPQPGADPLDNPMRRAIREAAGKLGPCASLSHLIGAPGQILRVRFGEPDAVQQALSAEAKRRFAAPSREPADVVVAGNHPWPGDPMQSFKVLIQHRSACRRGRILVGFFWTDPAEIDRSFPMAGLHAIAGSGAVGGWTIRRGLAAADLAARAFGSSSAFMIHWARELVVDREVLVYAPPLFDRVGPRLGPVRLFGDQARLWECARKLLRKQGVETPRVRVFPQGGLTYA
ncbi:MAG: lactate racemase domain-containing protein [Isosphaeraceae bacterium]